MRCPKCDSPMPIGGKVCKNCNFNAFTNQYENAPARPVQQPVQQAPVQQPVSRPAPQRPIIPPAQAPQRTVVKPTPAPRPVQQAAPVQQPPHTAQKPQKKKGNGFKRLMSGVLSLVLAVTAGYVAEKAIYHRKTIRNTIETAFSQPEKKAPSADFNALLSQWGISYTSKISGSSSECFAKEADQYTLEILEYGYNGDTVTEQYDTIYYDISEFNESQVQQLEEMLKNSVAENMPYCSAEYQRHGNHFFIVQLHIADMKSKENLSAMAAAGRIALTDGKVPDMISMEISRQGLLNNGYIQ